MTDGPPNPDGSYAVSSPRLGTVDAGDAFLVFESPPLDPDCTGHAVLTVDVAGWNNSDPSGAKVADPLRAYPSWPSYAAGAQPGRTIGPETLIDNRPMAIAQLDQSGRTVFDVTDLVRAWWRDRAFAGGGVPVDAPLVIDLRTGTPTVWHLQVGDAHPPTLDVVDDCSA